MTTIGKTLKFRCTRGHSWEVNSSEVENGAVVVNTTRFGGSKNEFCVCCIEDVLLRWCGTVWQPKEEAAVADI
jgi:hypothetical protein